MVKNFADTDIEFFCEDAAENNVDVEEAIKNFREIERGSETTDGSQLFEWIDE